MTTLWVITGLLVFAVAGLGLGVWQLSRLGRHGRRAVTVQPVQAPPLRSYGPMARLFDVADLQFLRSQRGCGPRMARRLRLERRAVLSLYLRQVRADFRQCWALCRAMAPVGENSELAPLAVKQLLVFYGLYALLRLHCLLAWFVFVRTDAGSLLAIVQRLQQRVQPAAGPGLRRSHTAAVG